MDCNFEKGWCGWRLEDETIDFKFQVLNGDEIAADEGKVTPAGELVNRVAEVSQKSASMRE